MTFMLIVILTFPFFFFARISYERIYFREFLGKVRSRHTREFFQHTKVSIFEKQKKGACSEYQQTRVCISGKYFFSHQNSLEKYRMTQSRAWLKHKILVSFCGLCINKFWNFQKFSSFHLEQIWVSIQNQMSSGLGLIF